MYFRLCNSLAIFQAMMNEIFVNMDNDVIVYIDNTIIFMKMDNLKEHDKTVQEVLWRLEENDLSIKPEKCLFHQMEIEFLRMIMR